MTRLSKRLSAAASLVPEGAALVDIGTDHGFLPIALLESKKIVHAIACDVKEGPLARAKEHRDAAGISPEIMEVRLSDGFAAIAPKEADAATILGMGGALIERILTGGAPREKGIVSFVLGPQSEVPRLRRYLLAQGYGIRTERLIFEDGKYYPLLLVAAEGEETDYTEAELFYGRAVLEERPPELRSFLHLRRTVLEDILTALPESESGANRRAEVMHELMVLDSI